jgi:hypothetical protein
LGAEQVLNVGPQNLALHCYLFCALVSG